MAFVPPFGSENKWTEFLKNINYEDFAKALKLAEEEEAYLKQLAESFASKETKNYSAARSIILDVHFRLEGILNDALRWYLSIYNRKDLTLDKKDFSALENAISSVEYFKKLKIVEALNIFSQQSIAIFMKVNDIRVAFAHNYKKDNPKYLYNGKQVFNRECIDEVIKGLKKVLDEFAKFIELRK